MATGVTLYLVSACGTAEEFVAAFRRYADRTGLFIPTAAPLPAGRRGHLTLTLKDGGVMIAGEAEILQSSAKPTVLQGRPGMTVKFVDADDLSKTVIAELEKARLAMKPAPPSVPPRPATVPAEPRPVVPAVGGRIDAANALAECVVIGDAAQLVDTSGAPKAASDAGSGKAKFAVPAILPVGAPRPNTPSTPPPLRPHSPSAPPPLGGIPSPVGSSPSGGIPRPKTPSVPPDPASKPLPRPASKSIPPRLTSIGFPTLDKQPGRSGATPKPAAAAPTGLASLRSPELISADDATAVGDFPPSPPPKKTDPMPTTAALADGMSGTTPGTTPPTPTGVQKLANRSGASPILDAAAGADGMSGTTPGTVPPAAPIAPMPAKPMAAVSPADGKLDRRTSIGFPAVRTPFETQPVGIVRPPGGTAPPAPPVVPSGVVAKSGVTPAPRGKNPTRPPLTPRHPTPVAPVPIVRSPAKAAPTVEDAIVESAIVEEEKTDLSEVPAAPGSGAGPLATPLSVDPHANTQIAPQRSGGMRASEIMAAIPTEDWTMSPDASAPTVLPTGAPVAAPATPAVESEPTPAPAMAPKGPPTGNWSISLDPETGWSEPAKLPAAPAAPAAEAPKKPRRKRGDGTSGNPDMAVADDEGFTAQKWDDKPTGIGEAKIEIDSTLMEPLKPMPALDDEADEPVVAAPAPDARSEHAIKYITPPAGLPAAGNGVPPPLSPGFPTPAAATVPDAFAAPAPSPFATGPVSTASPFAMPPSTPPQLFANAPRPMTDANLGFARGDYGAAAAVPPDAAKRKRTLFIGIGAVIALAGGFVLVLMLAGGKTKKPTPTAGTGSSSAQPAVVVDTQPATGSATEATGSGSADVAVGSDAAQPPDEPDGSAGSAAVAVAPTEAPPSSGACNVSVTSTPRGADVLIGDTKLGTTPAQLELPCGVEAKLTLRKAKYITTSRAFTPIDGKGNKVAFRLARPTFTLKVTSTPAGATIMVAGKSMGVTPATIRLPAYEGAAVMVGKAGYQTASKVVTPKSNNLSHHVVLKKKGKR